MSRTHERHIHVQVPDGKDKSEVVDEVEDSFVKPSPDGTSQVDSVSDADYVCSNKWLAEQKNLPDGIASVSCNSNGACTTTNDVSSDHDCTGVTATCFNNNCIPAGPNVCGLKFQQICIAPCNGEDVVVTGGRIDCSSAKRNGAKCKSAQPIGSYKCDSTVTATCTAGKYVESAAKCEVGVEIEWGWACGSGWKGVRSRGHDIGYIRGVDSFKPLRWSYTYCHIYQNTLAYCNV